ncbi:hypothetical protein QBC33DRAFT_600013 [Phialemonium atrogriseum]|uniref:Uncharacterized protein n=1 Tax=Phialemonium atrogriseum TaxID=1093897 RepID=A0AAJ0BSU7_9PEZI|nr:uncharacterized protein QBC33DRAFT_600013 [Phialemonium atrogriseum]KAK1762768.1 hypothetical protein QBC33DRAFT_600013 [Phialemonium atrogriseum]
MVPSTSNKPNDDDCLKDLFLTDPWKDMKRTRESNSPVKEIRPTNYLRRGLRAAAFPLRGIWYFLRRRPFYPLFVGRLLPLSIISFLVYFILFTFAFLPQFAFLAIFHGWGAWINAVVLVLGEGLVITQGLFEAFFVDEIRVDIFDATLINFDLIDLVAPHRVLFLDAPNSVKMLGKPTSRAEYTPWSIIQIVELIVFLPLNLVPYVGTPAFIIITGARLGKLAHHRWYKLRGLDRKQTKKEIRDRTWEYTWFGTVAMILELVPILSFFFLLTSTAGSAMWVAEIEKKKRAAEAGGGSDGEPVNAEQPGAVFHDDPV